jgi:hypothetical protein
MPSPDYDELRARLVRMSDRALLEYGRALHVHAVLIREASGEAARRRGGMWIPAPAES